MDTSQTAVMDAKKNTIESMSREELINKCKGLLGIAKQAKKAKDEFGEENQMLKDQLTKCETQREADKKSLLTMKEMLEQFTNNKLELASEINELRRRNKSLLEQETSFRREKETLSIENEALQRQVNRLTEDNESLLADINQMDEQLNQVNVLGKEQKQHLSLLELEVEKLNEYKNSNKTLATEFQDLQQTHHALLVSYNSIQTDSNNLAAKYQNLNEINSKQCKQFQGLSEQLIDVYKELKQLKECKRILAESHHEYADSVTRWQLQITDASNQLCSHIESLTKENTDLKVEIQTKPIDATETILRQFPILIDYCEKSIVEHRQQNELIDELKKENEKLDNEIRLKNQLNHEEHIKDDLIAFEDSGLKKESERLIFEDDTELKAAEMGNIISSLRSEIAVLTTQLAATTNFKEQLECDAASMVILSEKETQNLKEENAKLKEKTIIADETLNKMQSEVRRLEEELASACKNGEYKETNIFAAHLPILIDCCDRALYEYRKQNDVISNLRSKSDVKNDDEIIHNLSQDIENLKNVNTKLKEDLSNAGRNNAEVQDVLKLKNDLIANTQICEDLQTKLEKQERENVDLLNEMRELNEALKCRGDVISKQQAKHKEMVAEMKKNLNTLSKIEASMQSKEKQIEEKELKITKLSEDNKSALHEVNRLQNALRENESRLKMLSEEITTMRGQLENHDAKSEVLSTSTISRAEELARLREVDESFEEKYNKLRSLAVKMKKKSHEQSLCIADLEKQVVESKIITTDMTERIASLEGERENLQKELKTCKNHIESLKTEIEKLKVSKKHSNVLNLEIEAFEKSLNETSAKLTAKTAECKRMCETLQNKETAIEVLKKENKILEESKESEIFHAGELKKQIDKLQDQLKDVVHNKHELAAKLEECLNDKQSLQSKVDELNQRVVSLSKECEIERVKMLKEKENLVQRINSLENELNASNNRITVAERSFQDLENEFANYKVKAQSVLRQNQSKESSKERELEEELRLVKEEHKDLSERLQTFLEKHQANEKAVEELQEDNRCLSNRNSELQCIIAEIRQQSESIARENKKQLETYQEALKSHRVQIEALDACHIQQIQELHAKYNREIGELKSTQRKSVESFTHKPHEKIDYLLMEREDAEGSEAETTHTPKYLPARKRSSHDLVPLDELLSSPMVDSTYPVLERRQSTSPSIELQETKERLMKQESHVRHLTSLLAESEQDLARLTQLNEMLKEEVRRQERTVEREKHMHNSEYLKNVVLKFVSLNNGDERTRLVPVLNTILKLSPSETEMIQNVAKGKALDNNNRSWGSFLPSWSSS